MTDADVLSDEVSCELTANEIIIRQGLEEPWTPDLGTDIYFTIRPARMPTTGAPTGDFTFSSNLFYLGVAYPIDQTSESDMI